MVAAVGSEKDKQSALYNSTTYYLSCVFTPHHQCEAHKTNRHMGGNTLRLQTTNMALTTPQVQVAITTTPQGMIKSTYLPKNSIVRLQRIQNQAARILTKTPRRDHITEVLIDLHWLRIEERIVYKLLILTFKALIDRTAPLYLCELI